MTLGLQGKAGGTHHVVSVICGQELPRLPHSCCNEQLCVELPAHLRNTCTLVPTLNFACCPMARKETVILSWPTILTPTCWFREMKMGLSGTQGPDDVKLFGHVHLLTLLPALSKYCPP